jgi:hypothetical protein
MMRKMDLVVTDQTDDAEAALVISMCLILSTGGSTPERTASVTKLHICFQPKQFVGLLTSWRRKMLRRLACVRRMIDGKAVRA